MSKYIFSSDDAVDREKHGIKLKVYGGVNDDLSLTRISSEKGHFEEFKHLSCFIYYVIQGKGVFVLNDEEVEAKKGDVVSIPPNTRIHYFGNMELILIVNPPFKPENETHIRDIDPPETNS